VQRSYESLVDGERRALDRCSVFSDGFDLRSATYLSDGLDEYTVFEQRDSLVRKSLVTVDRHGARSVPDAGNDSPIRQRAAHRRRRRQ
jgi:predicted ATPase